MDFNDFTERIINGFSGFKSFEEHEGVIYKDREVGIAQFVIKCLANPKCEGSELILSHIQITREIKGGDKASSLAAFMEFAEYIIENHQSMIINADISSESKERILFNLGISSNILY